MHTPPTHPPARTHAGRELLERENWGSIDEAWAAFRRELELGRGIEVVDEDGNLIEPDGDDADFD